MRNSLVLIALLPVAAGAQMRLCDTCPDPPAIDLNIPAHLLHSQIERVLSDQHWMRSDEAILANMHRKVDTVLMSINVPVLQRFEFMSKIYQYVIADYRSELAKAELDARNPDAAEDPTGILHQGKSKLKGKRDFTAIIAEKQRALDRVIESRNKEMGEMTEQVK